MAINSRNFAFILLFLCLVNVSFSQENDTGSRHRITWTRDDYALRYEVLIEKEENNKYSRVLREFTEDPFLLISLPPGNYRLRVIPYDFRDIPGKGTGWKNFKVLAVTTQDSKSEPESRLVMEDALPSSPKQEENKTPIENITEDLTDNTDLAKPEKRKDLFVALLAEGLGYSRYNIAFGGGIVFGGSLDGVGIGLRLFYAQDSENFMFLETLAHIRFYFSREKDNKGFFMQLEGGVVFIAYETFESQVVTSPVLGLGAGWRFMMNKQWYIEPIIHLGYPYIFGMGFSTGFKFDL